MSADLHDLETFRAERKRQEINATVIGAVVILVAFIVGILVGMLWNKRDDT